MHSFESDLNKKNQLMLLLKLAKEDKLLDSREEKFIIDIALKLGLSGKEIETIFEEPEKLDINVPKSEKERMTCLYHLLFLMKINANTKIDEKRLCKKLGFKLGINPFLVEELMQIIDEYSGKLVPQGVMLDAVKKYLN